MATSSSGTTNWETRSQHSIALSKNDDLESPVSHQYIRRFFTTLVPLVHALLSVTLSLSLLYQLNGKRFRPQGEGTDFLCNSDIESIISGSLGLISSVGGFWVVSVVWRCARILLESLEYDGLGLDQLNKMIQFRIPPAWTRNCIGGTALVLAMNLPSASLSVFLPGSVNWVPVTGYDSKNITSLPGGFGSLRRYPGELSFDSQWEQNIAPWAPMIRYELLMRALGFYSTGWSPQALDFQGSRYIAKQEAPVKTTVFDVPMPYIEIHNLTWDKVVKPWVKKKIVDKSHITYTRSSDFHPVFKTSTILFGEDTDLPTTNPDLIAPRVLSLKRKIAVIVGDPRVDEVHGNCLIDALNSWDDVLRIDLVDDGDSNCWAVGTVNFTVGIQYFRSARYITRQAVEALPEPFSDMRPLEGDKWSEFAVLMLSDLMTAISMVRPTRLPTRNLTEYAELQLRQAYISMRSALKPYEPDPPNLRAMEPVTYLEAKVNHSRVIFWLILNLLLPASGIIVSWMEEQSKSRLNIYAVEDIDTAAALAPLLRGAQNTSYGS